MYLRVVRIDHRSDEGVPIALLFRDEVAQPGDKCTIVSLCLAIGMLMVRGRRNMFDVKAGHCALKMSGSELRPFSARMRSGNPYAYAQYVRNDSVTTWDMLDFSWIARVNFVEVIRYHQDVVMARYRPQ